MTLRSLSSLWFKYLLFYYAVINTIGVFVNIIDKRRSVKHKWRIKENVLWQIALLGGALGSYLTMIMIRHKTKHKSFMIGMPVLALLQIATIIYIFFAK